MENKIGIHHIGFGSEIVSEIEYMLEKEVQAEEMLAQDPCCLETHCHQEIKNPVGELLEEWYQTISQKLYIR